MLIFLGLNKDYAKKSLYLKQFDFKKYANVFKELINSIFKDYFIYTKLIQMACVIFLIIALCTVGSKLKMSDFYSN